MVRKEEGGKLCPLVSSGAGRLTGVKEGRAEVRATQADRTASAKARS